MKIYDITLTIRPGMPVWPGDPAFERKLIWQMGLDSAANVSQVTMSVHTGTHVDAPRHFFPNGAALDRFPLERFVGPGVVLDCRPTMSARYPEQSVEGLAEQLRRFPLAPNGLALLWTEGTPVTIEAARLLLQAGAGLVGIDAPSIDSQPYPVHRLLLERDVLIVEDLRGLDRLGAGPVDCAFLPLALTGTDGAPIRAIAWR